MDEFENIPVERILEYRRKMIYACENNTHPQSSSGVTIGELCTMSFSDPVTIRLRISGEINSPNEDNYRDFVVACHSFWVKS